jgi:hypothetical protein
MINLFGDVRRTILVVIIAATAGCRSAGIDVTIQNNSRTTLRNVELDYPHASFGTGAISPGASYWYHIKPTEHGDVVLSFEQEDGATVKQKGPTLDAGDKGRLILTLTEDGKKHWHMQVGRR